MARLVSSSRHFSVAGAVSWRRMDRGSNQGLFGTDRNRTGRHWSRQPDVQGRMLAGGHIAASKGNGKSSKCMRSRCGVRPSMSWLSSSTASAAVLRSPRCNESSGANRSRPGHLGRSRQLAGCRGPGHHRYGLPQRSSEVCGDYQDMGNAYARFRLLQPIGRQGQRADGHSFGRWRSRRHPGERTSTQVLWE